MKEKGLIKLQIILIVLYTISILLFSYLAVSTLINQPPTECNQPLCGIGLFFGSYAWAASMGIFTTVLAFQILFYLMIIFKKEWLTEHISFKVIAFLLLIPFFLVIILAAFPKII